ncbi:MAG: hypothetical protein A2V46_00415 [Bacteroidetes bacterium RBG_19FT_COMBO_42_7]|nr:MAG: hypothetical protein A2V46_00415 [Bacteroidetes bacterium RBG_19FT_COMBO_42_7]
MKNTGKIAAMLLVLLAACSLSLNAQRGMRGMRPDSAGIGRMNIEQRQLHPGIGRLGMSQGIHQPGMGMNRTPGFRQYSPGFRTQFPGMWAMENIPNLTDNQKKDIADLKGKQMAEMEKLRIDMQSKVKELNEAHKAKVMSILTPEQKKWVEENTPGQPAK